jgi:C-terminal processing protease CtpA/Prc
LKLRKKTHLVKVVSPIEGPPIGRFKAKRSDHQNLDDTAVSLSLNDAVKKMRGEPKAACWSILPQGSSRIFRSPLFARKSRN